MTPPYGPRALLRLDEFVRNPQPVLLREPRPKTKPATEASQATETELPSPHIPEATVEVAKVLHPKEDPNADKEFRVLVVEVSHVCETDCQKCSLLICFLNLPRRTIRSTCAC